MTDELSKKETEIVDGTVWNQFCDTLEDGGQRRDGAEHAERSDESHGRLPLLEPHHARGALQTFVEHNDPLAPVLAASGPRDRQDGRRPPGQLLPERRDQR